MVQLKMFENKLFSLSIFCGFVSFVAMFCNNIILPFYLQDVMEYTPQHSGMKDQNLTPQKIPTII